MEKKGSGICYGLVVIVVTAIVIASGNFVFADENSCAYCGMKKAMFGHSWVTVTHEDGSTVGVCSVHCAAVDMALNIDKPAKNITVGDYNSKKPIEADTAFWVIGGNKMGVMTARAKWAFDSKDAADNFIKQNGGKPATFEDVMKATFEDMYEDTLMIQKKRKMKKMKK
jgi:nitrous oxide reductase accessory protein NosL